MSTTDLEHSGTTEPQRQNQSGDQPPRLQALESSFRELSNEEVEIYQRASCKSLMNAWLRMSRTRWQELTKSC